MQIRAPIALQAVLKALTEVILPAVDPANSMAQEQSKLVVGLLSLILHRLPQQFAYDLDELERLATTAAELHAIAPDASLAGAIDDGRALVARAGASPQEIIDGIADLRAVIGDIAAVAADQSDDAGQQVRGVVLAMAAEQALRERSWLLMQGWEIDPTSVPAIETLIPALAAKEPQS